MQHLGKVDEAGYFNYNVVAVFNEVLAIEHSKILRRIYPNARSRVKS